MDLDKTVKWIDKTWRDKFCKAIQYACRFLKHRFQQMGNKQAAQKFDSLFSNMRDARKLFRLFKTINQAKKIKDYLGQQLTIDVILNIVVRVFFGMYWIFDNLNILSKIKILSYDSKVMAKYGASFWLLALLTNLVLLIKNLLQNFSKTEQLRKVYFSCSTQSQIRQKKKEYQNSLSKRLAIVLNIVKVVGDIIPAGQASQFFNNYLKFNANDSACGLGGFIAAVLTSYQLYQ